VVAVTVDETRSQWRNRQVARHRLRDRLAAVLAPDPPQRKQTRPSRSAKQRRLDAKRARSQQKSLRKPPAEQD